MRSLRGFPLCSASSAFCQHGFSCPATLCDRRIIRPGRCAEFPKHRLESLGINVPSPAYDHGFDAVASFSILPITAIPSTQEGNHIRTNMVLTKNLQWPVHRRFPVVNESIDALLSCCHLSARHGQPCPGHLA